MEHLSTILAHLLPIIPFFGTIGAGDTILASDFISTSDGTSGKVAKTNSNGVFDSSFIPGYFGDGSDGALTFDGTSTVAGLVPSSSIYTMTRDLYATTLVVNTGVTIITGNWRIFCATSIGGAGTIKQDGNAGANGSYSGGRSSGGAAITGYFTTQAGGYGASGQTNESGGSGASSSQAPRSASAQNGGAGYNGAAAGSGGSNTLFARFYAFLQYIVSGIDSVNGAKITMASAGGGGNGNSASYTGSGGGGGTSGGFVWIVTRLWQGTFTIQAQGGNGGNGGNGGGSSGSGNDQGGGGGSGGDGGFAFIAYISKTWTGSYSLTGGTKGTKGTGSTGKNGSDGTNGGTGTSLEVALGSLQ